jgi:hypothetical protein
VIARKRHRSLLVLSLAALLPLLAGAPAAEPPAQAPPQGPAPPPGSGPPLTYELIINGEAFQVEANRAVKLESRKQPGVVYDVALRIAPTQRVRMNTFRFDYDLPAQIHDDGGRKQRSVRLVHELGFTMLLTDLGGPVDPSDRDKALTILTDSVEKSLDQRKVTDVKLGEPRDLSFDGAGGRGRTIHYQDAQGFGHTDVVCLLAGEGFAATCVVEYVDADAEDVVPLIRRVLDSVRAAP